MDDGFGVWRGSANPANNITFSYNLLGEGLKGHSTSIIVGANVAFASGVTNVDMHHNLLMNNTHRNPLLKNKSSRVVNNIHYNHVFYSNQVGGNVVHSEFRLRYPL